MKQTKKSLLIVSLSIFLQSTPLSAGSVAGFGGATEVTQILNNIELANQYVLQISQYQQQVQQYINQFNSYKMMLMKIGKLPQKQWDQFTKNIDGLKRSLEFGTALSYTSGAYTSDFNKLFPGFEKHYAAITSGNMNFEETYKTLNNSTRDTVNGALQSLGLQAEDMDDDEVTMKELELLSQSAKGQLGAIQAANAIAVHQSHTLKKLQKTIMTQANMQGAYMATKNEKQAIYEAKRAAFNSNRFEDDPNDDVLMP